MAGGLAALLDDVAALARLAAASADDVAAASAKAGSKAIGVVIDDAGAPWFVAQRERDLATARTFNLPDIPALKKAVEDPDLDVTGDDVLVLRNAGPGGYRRG